MSEHFDEASSIGEHQESRSHRRSILKAALGTGVVLATGVLETPSASAANHARWGAPSVRNPQNMWGGPPAQGSLSPSSLAVEASSAPPTATKDELWYDTSADLLKRFDGSAWVASGTSTFALSDSLGKGIKADFGGRQWSLVARQADTLLDYPVPTFRPTSNNTTIALDLMPRGTPTDTGNGFAWMDVCDSDVRDTSGGGIVGAARVGIRATAVQFSSVAYGKTPLPLQLCVGQDSPVLTLTTDHVTHGASLNGPAYHEVVNYTSGSESYAELSATVRGGGRSAVRQYGPATDIATGYADAAQVDASGAGGLFLTASNSAGSVKIIGGDCSQDSKKIEVNGAGIGFFAATPVPRQTVSGSRDGNIALASLISTLANLGLIADGTS